MSQTMGTKPPSDFGHYDANYGNFQTDVYAEIRREAFGIDIGQSSWITADEQDHYLEWLNLSKGKVLLDVACGSAGPALRIAEKTGCSIVGIDAHADAIATATALAAERGFGQRAEFRIVDAAGTLPFSTNYFDAITCIDAINHLPDRPNVLAEWFRVLKPAGRLLFTDPITITGPLTKEEIAVRSSIGYFLFVPVDYDQRILQECGFKVLLREDATQNMADLAGRRGAARAVRRAVLLALEGNSTYEGQQKFFEVAARIAKDRCLSRFVYIAEKPS
jgi:SAM-dependent methyltransferase